MNPHAVSITSKEHAELVSVPPASALAPEEVRGRTLCSLVSPGTELAANYQGANFPNFPGYAAVFEVQEVGEKVTRFRSGDIAFAMGGHRSVQQVIESRAVPVPKGLDPQKAVLARLMGVTMTTLMTTMARPGDRVMVTGAGPVGFLGANLFARAGYEVFVVEPNERRHAALKHGGISAVYSRVPVDDKTFAGTVALALECSGHEQAVLDACKVARKRGEVVLVGVPWGRRTDLWAFDLLHAVFHRYVVLRSGWEWELQHLAADFHPHSIFGNFALAMKWLAEGQLHVSGLTRLCDPKDPQPIYQDLLNRRGDALFCVFDWSRLDADVKKPPKKHRRKSRS